MWGVIMLTDIRKEISIPEGVKVSIDNKLLTFEGKQGKVSRLFSYKNVGITQEGNTIVLEAKKAKKRDKTMIGTYAAHIKNMIKGVNEGIVYKLKVISTHFPMTVSFANNELTIKNFFGEKHPRVLKITVPDVKVKVNGNIIELNGSDIEKVGIVAEQIEQTTRMVSRDRRVFQDGIYIIEKAGKSLL